MSINLVQDFKVEVDTTELLKKYLELAIPTILGSTQEIAVKIVEHTDNLKTLYCFPKDERFPIILIGGWYKKENRENSFFNGYKPWKLFDTETALKDSIDYILDFINVNQNNLKNEFLEQYGDGYHKGFNYFDGIIDIGYQVTSNNTFPASISLSLAHIYYGK